MNELAGGPKAEGSSGAFDCTDRNLEIRVTEKSDDEGWILPSTAFILQNYAKRSNGTYTT